MLNNKFKIENNKLVLVDKDEIIPEDEPIFILRGRDQKALASLVGYQGLCEYGQEWNVMQVVIESFRKFRNENPELMGTPLEVY